MEEVLIKLSKVSNVEFVWWLISVKAEVLIGLLVLGLILMMD